MEEMAQLYNTLDETFRGIKIVKAFTIRAPGAQALPRHAARNTIRRHEDRPLRFALAIRITEMMGILTICLAILAGAWLVLQGANAPAGHPHERPAAGPATR